MQNRNEQLGREIVETCLCTRLRQAARAITQLYDERLSECGVRAAQLGVLAALAESPGVSHSQLAERLTTERSTLSRNLELLVRDGLVRADETDDKRRSALTLTPRGRKRLERALPEWRKLQASLTRAISADEAKRLSHALGLVIAASQEGC